MCLKEGRGGNNNSFPVPSDLRAGSCHLHAMPVLSSCALSLNTGTWSWGPEHSERTAVLYQGARNGCLGGRSENKRSQESSLTGSILQREPGLSITSLVLLGPLREPSSSWH